MASASLTLTTDIVLTELLGRYAPAYMNVRFSQNMDMLTGYVLEIRVNSKIRNAFRGEWYDHRLYASRSFPEIPEHDIVKTAIDQAAIQTIDKLNQGDYEEKNIKYYFDDWVLFDCNNPGSRPVLSKAKLGGNNNGSESTNNGAPGIAVADLPPETQDQLF
jgi:hypothetical protein